jgi:hypothetical protein
MPLKPSPEGKASPELLLAVVMAVAIWGVYGFPRYIEAALVLIALICVAAFVWNKSKRQG